MNNCAYSVYLPFSFQYSSMPAEGFFFPQKFQHGHGLFLYSVQVVAQIAFNGSCLKFFEKNTFFINMSFILIYINYGENNCIPKLPADLSKLFHRT